MAKELAFLIINPYTLSKSRTGGVIARVISRTDLDFVAARMFGPSSELASEYASLIREGSPKSDVSSLIADYVETNYAPDPVTGKRRRVMLLMFEGENAVEKIWNVTGSATLRWGSGETIRDTYGDYITDADGTVKYFEPAVLIAPTVDRAKAALKLWSKYSVECGGIIDDADDVPESDEIEKTLVMLKPDNFQFRSLRPGNIIDLLSCSSLRIVGVKKFSMSVAQAEKFYGPVEDALTGKFSAIGSARLSKAIEDTFHFKVPEERLERVCDELAPLFGKSQFDSIVKFITGYIPSEVSEEDKAKPGKESCLALVYCGRNAVNKIRNILGPTDPSKALPGSVRKEFGSNIMVNAAHASDSPDNAVREMGIIDIIEDTITPLVEEVYNI